MVCSGRVHEKFVWRAFEKGGESYRDPKKAISHAATARQAARFYLLLDRGAAVSQYWSEWMLARMEPVSEARGKKMGEWFSNLAACVEHKLGPAKSTKPPTDPPPATASARARPRE